MILRFSAGLMAVAMLIGGTVQAQTVNDARQTARTPWSPEKLTAAVVKGCGVPRSYFAVERDFDGYARLRESPSVTPEQHKCALKVVSNYRVPVRK